MITHPFLKDLLADWFKSEPELEHFYVRQLMTDWIVCDCIDWRLDSRPVRYSFKIENDRVKQSNWPTSPFISTSQYFNAADPDFLSNLRDELIKACVRGRYIAESTRTH